MLGIKSFSAPWRWLCTSLCSLVAAFGLETPVQAQSNPAWSFGGFGTAGLVDQFGGGPWKFVRSSNQSGANRRLSATPDSRLGAQVNWNGGQQWEGAIQGVLLDTPPGTPIGEAIQWAYLGFRPLPDMRFRLGRTSPDIFLFADSRNVGFAIPWVRPPADFYGFLPLASSDGLDYEQRWSLGDASWRGRASAGVVRSSVVANDGSRVPLQGKGTVAFGLTREEGGLLLKVSYLRSRVQVDAGADAALLQQSLDEIGTLPVPGVASAVAQLQPDLWAGGTASYLGLAAQYDKGPWTFISEGSQLWVPNSPLSGRRGYVSLGWRHDSVTYYGIVSRVMPSHGYTQPPNLVDSLTPAIGAAQAMQAQALVGYAVSEGNNYRYDQSTLSAGLRWDFASNAALKVQVDRFNVHGNGGAGFTSYDGAAGRGTLVSVAIDFVVGP